MPYQRIVYINKAGNRMDVVLQIVKKLSKVIIVKDTEGNLIAPIPRNSVESISDPVKENNFDNSD
jgi:hypothetical protein